MQGAATGLVASYPAPSPNATVRPRRRQLLRYPASHPGPLSWRIRHGV